jgi:pimeloyl-ACP methyl ester carboxylesterase
VALALAAQYPQLCRRVVVIEATWHGLRYATTDFVSAYAQLNFSSYAGAAERPRRCFSGGYRACVMAVPV